MGIDEPRQGREVVAPFEHREHPAAAEARRRARASQRPQLAKPASVTPMPPSGSPRQASKPADSTRTSGANAASAGSTRPRIASA